MEVIDKTKGSGGNDTKRLMEFGLALNEALGSAIANTLAKFSDVDTYQRFIGVLSALQVLYVENARKMYSDSQILNIISKYLPASRMIKKAFESDDGNG